MSRLTDEVGAFAGSQHFLLLDDHLKDGAEPLLEHWCEQVGDVVSEEAMDRALRSVARLDAPLAQRRAFPRLLREFLEYLPVTGRFPLGGEWAQRVDSMEAGVPRRLPPGRQRPGRDRAPPRRRHRPQRPLSLRQRPEVQEVLHGPARVLKPSPPDIH